MGALTSKPYAFNARPWELQSFESIDLGDSIGSGIRMDARGSTILRVLPTLNEFLNEEWINDRTRFSYDGLTSQRLATPLLRTSKLAAFSKVSWPRLFSELKIALPLFDSSFDSLVGKTTSFEALVFAKHLFRNANFVTEGSSYSDYDFQADYLFSSTHLDFAVADFFLIIGTNLRFEAPSVNLKIKKSLKDSSLKKVFTSGVSSDLTYPSVSLGSVESFWPKFSTGRHKISRLFYRSVRPFLILGENSSIASSNIFTLASSKTGFHRSLSFNKEWRGINFLSLNASSNAFKDLSLGSKVSSGHLNFCYILGSDNVRFESFFSTFVIYQGYGGDWGASNANVVIPTLHPYESSRSSYINVYGKIQSVFRSQFSSAGLVDDSTFFHYLAKFLNLYAPRRPFLGSFLKSTGFFRYASFHNFSISSSVWSLSSCSNFLNIYPYLKTKKAYLFSYYFFRRSRFNSFFAFFLNSFHSYSFYLIDSVTRSSHVMALTHRRFRSLTVFR